MEKNGSMYLLMILSFSIIVFSPASSQKKISPASSPKNITETKVCKTEECLSAAQNLKESMNTSFDPCQNFYMYACGNWQKHQRPRSSRSRDKFELRSEENDKKILDFLRQDNNLSDPEPVRKARNLFSLCLKNDTYRGVSQIAKILEKIGVRDVPFDDDINRSNDFDYTTALARANKLAGVKVYFNLGVIPNPYNRTENLIALRRPSLLDMDGSIMPMTGGFRIRKRRESGPADEQVHREIINGIVTAMCENSTWQACVVIKHPFIPAPFDWIATKIIELNDDLPAFMEDVAFFPPKNSSRPDIGLYSLYQLQTLSDSIANDINGNMSKLNWTRYIEEMFTGLDNVTLNLTDPNKVQIAVEQVEYHKNILRFIYTGRADLMNIERDIWWKVVTTLLPYVDLGTSDDRRFLSTVDRFRSNRESRCAAITTASFGMGIYYSYSTKKQYINAKKNITEIFEFIRKSFRLQLSMAYWIDAHTKGTAFRKLELLKSNIAYPSINNGTSNVDDFYHDVNITDNFFDTMVSKIQIEVDKMLRRLNKPNNLNEDFWTPPDIVNGYYIPNRNTIVIPPGLIGGSFYSDSLRALNYGSMGSILGHELIHAFTGSGRHYNEKGNIENWWKNETSNKYKERSKCYIESYANDNITLENGTTLYGDVNKSIASLEEHISDNLGFKLSLWAYRMGIEEPEKEPVLPEFERFTHEQVFSLAYANLFCENPTWTWDMNIDNHSPNIIRVNGVFKNFWEFVDIWKCAPNKRPLKHCSLW